MFNQNNILPDEAREDCTVPSYNIEHVIEKV